MVSKFFVKHLVKPYDEKKSKLSNTLRLISEIGGICVAAYLIRLFIKQINGLPRHPLRNIYGFNPRQVLESNGGVILSLAVLLYVKDPLKSKLDRLFE